MKAAFTMLRQALSEGRIDHEADAAYPAIHQSDLPTSVQRPHPPFMVGGGGPKLLAFAASRAEIVGIDPRSLAEGGSDPTDITPDAVDRKVGWIREAAAGRRQSPEISIIVWNVFPRFRSAADAPPPNARGLSGHDLLECPHFLVGDTEQMVDALLARRERWGITDLTISADDLATCEPVIARLASA